MSEESKTVQKKLNLREPYAEALEEAAKEVYGSTYKQARVVEALIDQTRYQPDEGRIKDDLRRNRMAGGPSVELPEEEEDETDVEEMDVKEKLSRLKELDVDRGEVVAEWLAERGPDRITRKLVVNVVENEAGYSQSMAYNIAREALDNLVPSAFNGENLDEWAQETAANSNKTLRSFEAFAGVDESDVPQGVWYRSQELAREDYQEAVVKARISDVPEKRRKAAFERLADARPEYVDEQWVESERDLL